MSDLTLRAVIEGDVEPSLAQRLSFGSDFRDHRGGGCPDARRALPAEVA